jgi:hypothetical protein
MALFVIKLHATPDRWDFVGTRDRWVFVHGGDPHTVCNVALNNWDGFEEATCLRVVPPETSRAFPRDKIGLLLTEDVAMGLMREV